MQRYPKRIWTVLTLFVCLLPILAPAAAAPPIGEFSNGSLDGWEEKSFVGNTLYTLVEDNGSTVLKAVTHGAASGMFRETEVDLTKTPYLNWRWRIEDNFGDNDELSKAGDDYPARIYVVVSGGILFWKTRAINYVWSSNQPTESHWENAYTSNAKMIAVRSGNTEQGHWLSEKRNVRADLKQLFGKDIDTIHAIAIMSDGDNTGKSATAYYGDIFFSAD